MEDRRVVPNNRLPAQPVSAGWTGLLMYLILDKFSSPTWIWALGATAWGLFFVLHILKALTEKETEIKFDPYQKED